jgi:hypothetical protein
MLIDVWVSFWNTIYDVLLWKNPIGAPVVRLGDVINVTKGGMALWILGCMLYFNTFTLTMKIYLVLHGTYGWLWLLKELYTPDKAWDARVTPSGSVLAFLLLWSYGTPAWLIASNKSVASDNLLCFAIFLWGLGAVLMMVRSKLSCLDVI